MKSHGLLGMNQIFRLLLLASLILFWLPTAQAQESGEVLVLSTEGPLTPAMAEYLDRGLAEAQETGAALVILRMDTPGGAIDLMNRMVRSLRASSVPVVVYVAPQGAIAGSAGTVITLAGHVAAMAPETAIGAASPVGLGGEELGETIETKEKEILKATVRSLAERRGPEAVALAEATIDEARAASAAEALEVGLIDVVALDLDDLLRQLDGFEVEVAGTTQTLQTEGLTIIELPMSFIEQVLQALTNPNLIFLLMTIGVQAILIEISSPGGWVAGLLGVTCLALGAYGLGVLPVNWFGLIFIITAFVLFLLEVKTPTFGALTAAGVISLIVGAVVLFISPGTPAFQRVSTALVVGTALATTALFLGIVIFALRAQRRPIDVGWEALIGKQATARTALEPAGKVALAGEIWTAELVEGEQVEAGTVVEVISVEGLKVRVRRPTKDKS